MKIAVLFVGNVLMLDDGVGPATYEQIMLDYVIPENVDMFNVGCMSMDMLSLVETYDLLISVDAVENSGEKPGTVFRYTPDDLTHRTTPMGSLHELKLADLFDAAGLMGYTAEGLCFGMQVENASPASLIQGLTPAVHEALPMLVDTVIAELCRRGCTVTRRDGLPLPPVQTE